MTAPTTTPLLDAHGRSLSDVRLELGEDRSKWPKPKRKPTASERIGEIMGFIMENPCCWLCELSAVRTKLEIHHIAGGNMRTRLDWRWNFARLCRDCHDGKTKDDGIGKKTARILYLKATLDPEGTDWLELTKAYRFFLPEPEAGVTP